MTLHASLSLTSCQLSIKILLSDNPCRSCVFTQVHGHTWPERKVVEMGKVIIGLLMTILLSLYSFCLYSVASAFFGTTIGIVVGLAFFVTLTVIGFKLATPVETPESAEIKRLKRLRGRPSVFVSSDEGAGRIAVSEEDFDAGEDAGLGWFCGACGCR